MIDIRLQVAIMLWGETLPSAHPAIASIKAIVSPPAGEGDEPPRERLGRSVGSVLSPGVSSSLARCIR